MKIHISPFKSLKGSALIVTAILAVVVAGTLASYLVLVGNENTQVARSQTWNKSLMLAEAGVEDAMALINQNVGNLLSVSGWNANTAGWNNNNNVYSVTRVVDPNIGEYTVYITNLNDAPTILSIGKAYWPNGWNGQAPPPTRKVLVTTINNGLISGALVAKKTIDFKGNNVTIDSFVSTTNLYSMWMPQWGWGTYTNTKRTANGDVATDINILNVGNAEVYGHLRTGPGGIPSIGSNGSVGNTNWIGPDPSSPLNLGLQPGYTRDDMNQTFPDVVLTSDILNGTVLTPAKNKNQATIFTLGGTTNAVWYTVINQTSAGTNPVYYTIGSSGSPANTSILINASNVVLYLPGGLNYQQGADILGINTNASVKIYTDAAFSVSGQASIDNQTPWALALAIYGTTNATSMTLGGNTALTGYVYAPEASLGLGGGGNNIYDTVGAYVVNDIAINGHFNFHYDEALKLLGPSKGYIAVGWREVYP